jgi:AraC family transcriptional regulator, regulatory protein of adaptative response / methylated-DNA-[protein]-cysteine methyltransferase
MKNISDTHYKQVSKAIAYLTENGPHHSNLCDVAQYCDMSTSSLQRLFSSYVGLSPKQFVLYMSTEHAKGLLERGCSTLNTSVHSGLSSSGRLHDHFVKIESMTPGAYKNAGSGLQINYSYHGTPYGNVLIASTDRGICHLAFCNNLFDGEQNLRTLFSHAELVQQPTSMHTKALDFFDLQQTSPQLLTLHLRGTPFQIKVWHALLSIPSGSLSSYGELACFIGHDKAHRAVGTAIGCNPISYIIPCHRVIQSSGVIGNYMWGPERKKLILAHEVN